MPTVRLEFVDQVSSTPDETGSYTITSTVYSRSWVAPSAADVPRSGDYVGVGATGTSWVDWLAHVDVKGVLDDGTTVLHMSGDWFQHPGGIAVTPPDPQAMNYHPGTADFEAAGFTVAEVRTFTYDPTSGSYSLTV